MTRVFFVLRHVEGDLDAAVVSYLKLQQLGFKLNR